jgi:hypothetical protein
MVGTSTEGQLGVLSIDPPGFRRWSMRAEARYAAGSPGWNERLVAIVGDELIAMDATNGERLWSTSVPAGEFCGLKPALAGEKVALCLSGVVLVYDGQNRGLEGGFYRNSSGAMSWLP